MSEVLGGTSVAAQFARRVQPVEQLAGNADQIARACLAMAARFHDGGKLIVFGNGAAATDAQHIAVEFVHPVLVGKPALPAISLTADVATLTAIAGQEGFTAVFAHQLRRLADPTDIALGISVDGQCGNVRRGLEAAGGLGLLTVALAGGDGGAIAAADGIDHLLLSPATEPQVVKEVHVTTYHLLWELVHVFLAHPGVLADPRVREPALALARTAGGSPGGQP